MFFSEIGLLLKNKREKMGISHEDVVNKFKISLRNVIAIENGDLDELPHEAYIRTFAKGYAEFIGFSSEEIKTMLSDVDDFKNQGDFRKNFEPKKVQAHVEEGKSKNVRFIIQLLLVALLGASAYFYYVKNGRSETFNFNFLVNLFQSDEPREVPSFQNNGAEKNQKEESTTKELLVDTNNKKDETSDDTEPKQTEPKASDTVSDENLDKKSTEEDALQDGEDNVAPQNADLDTSTLRKEDRDFFDENDLATFIANTPEAFVIDWNILSDVEQGQQQAVIYVSQDCWMHVTVDGEARHFTLRKGNQREFLFNDSLDFRLGNASAVTLFHNRKLVNVGDSTVLRTVNLKAN